MTTTPSDPTPRPLIRIRSDQLLQGRDEVVILHGAVEYRLRRTQADKLILTK